MLSAQLEGQNTAASLDVSCAQRHSTGRSRLIQQSNINLLPNYCAATAMHSIFNIISF